MKFDVKKAAAMLSKGRKMKGKAPIKFMGKSKAAC